MIASGGVVRCVFPVMGTMTSIAVAAHDVYRLGAERVDEAVQEARRELERLDARFSHYSTDSDISRWIAGDEIAIDAQVEIEMVLAECARLSGESGGVFLIVDPRTGRLDTAGYVKGYAIDNAVAAMRDLGLANFAIGVGGDVYCAGQAQPGRPWRVAVQDPRECGRILAVLDAQDSAVATSGRAERGDHLWARPGDAVSDLLSFTVVGPSIAEADAYATIGFVTGDGGAAWVAAHEGYRSVMVRADGSVVSDAALVSAA